VGRALAQEREQRGVPELRERADAAREDQEIEIRALVEAVGRKRLRPLCP
jgi:hypothetical protein